MPLPTRRACPSFPTPRFSPPFSSSPSSRGGQRGHQGLQRHPYDRKGNQSSCGHVGRGQGRYRRLQGASPYSLPLRARTRQPSLFRSPLLFIHPLSACPQEFTRGLKYEHRRMTPAKLTRVERKPGSEHSASYSVSVSPQRVSLSEASSTCLLAAVLCRTSPRPCNASFGRAFCLTLPIV